MPQRVILPPFSSHGNFGGKKTALTSEIVFCDKGFKITFVIYPLTFAPIHLKDEALQRKDLCFTKEREPLLIHPGKTLKMVCSEVKYGTYFASCAGFSADHNTGFHELPLNVYHVDKKILTSIN